MTPTGPPRLRCPDLKEHNPHRWFPVETGGDERWCEGDPVPTLDDLLPGVGKFAAEKELRDWWQALAGKDADAVVPKAVEYSAYDLDIMGHALLAWSAKDWSAADPGERSAVGQEMAVAYYVLGKVARLIGAYHEGRLPSNDTWDDIRIYATMAARIRATGRWGL